MPSGAGPGGGRLFSTVGRNWFDGGASIAWGWDRHVVKPTAMEPAIATTPTHAHALRLRRRSDATSGGFRPRRLSNRRLESVMLSFVDRIPPAGRRSSGNPPPFGEGLLQSRDSCARKRVRRNSRPGGVPRAEQISCPDRDEARPGRHSGSRPLSHEGVLRRKVLGPKKLSPAGGFDLRNTVAS